MQSNEILIVVESVSNEKGLNKEVIFKAIETAIASASQRHFHEDAELHVSIDRDTGEYITQRDWIVLDENDIEFHKKRILHMQNQILKQGIFILKLLIMFHLDE